MFRERRYQWRSSNVFDQLGSGDFAARATATWVQFLETPFWPRTEHCTSQQKPTSPRLSTKSCCFTTGWTAASCLIPLSEQVFLFQVCFFLCAQKLWTFYSHSANLFPWGCRRWRRGRGENWHFAGCGMTDARCLVPDACHEWFGCSCLRIKTMCLLFVSWHLTSSNTLAKLTFNFWHQTHCCILWRCQIVFPNPEVWASLIYLAFRSAILSQLWLFGIWHWNFALLWCSACRS